MTGKTEMEEKTRREESLLESVGRGKAEAIVVAKIKVGVSLLKALEEVARRQKIQAGIILSGVGALRCATFRNLKEFPQEFPVQPKNRLYFRREQPLEILSLSGHISRNAQGEPEVHAHFSASAVEGDRIVAFGGHLTEDALTFVKVVVAVAVLSEINMVTEVEPVTKFPDLVIRG
ncbi:MAG: DNA-binding protein [candidate division NC10 bacterium]|nr:DNA-binding protein [candidate division NC10 bacterium]